MSFEVPNSCADDLQLFMLYDTTLTKGEIDSKKIYTKYSKEKPIIKDVWKDISTWAKSHN